MHDGEDGENTCIVFKRIFDAEITFNSRVEKDVSFDVVRTCLSCLMLEHVNDISQSVQLQIVK